MRWRLVAEQMLLGILVMILLTNLILSSTALTSLDYHLGQSKYSDSSISEEESFHGPSCALLSVEKEGNYVRVSITLEEPLALEDLDQLSMWINPLSGDGKIQIEIYLDGDGDGGYDGDSQEDARLRSARESWSDLGMPPSEWNELDGFDLDYEEYGGGTAGGLDDLKDELGAKKVVRIYITIYKDGSVPQTSAYIDYIKIGDQIISFEPLEKEDVKSGTKSVSPGSLITYVITYANNGIEPADIVVLETYDRRTSFVESSVAPDPGTDNLWTFRHLPAGAHGQIVVKVRATKSTCKASIRGGVEGRGYASTSGMLSTDFESYPVTNRVSIRAGEYNFTDSATTTVRSIEGSVLSYGEHGSGSYSSKERLSYTPSSISVYRDVSANRGAKGGDLTWYSMPICGAWFASLRGENKVRDIFWSDRYYQGEKINFSSRLLLAKSQTFLETSAQFSGMADRTSRWNRVLVDQRFSGEFNISSSARARWSNKSIKSQDEILDCCPLIDGWQQQPQA